MTLEYKKTLVSELQEFKCSCRNMQILSLWKSTASTVHTEYGIGIPLPGMDKSVASVYTRAVVT